MSEKTGKMTPEKVVEQLKTLIEDAESHREPDGALDQIFEDDIAALKFAIEAIKAFDALDQIFEDDIAALKFAIEAIKAFDALDESLTAILKECVGG